MLETTAQKFDRKKVEEIFNRPLLPLILEAANVHAANFPEGEIQKSKLLSIKTGACREDCKYCSQSAHYQTQVEKERLLELEAVLNAAKQAKEEGADRFCMGAAWREVKDGEQFERVKDMVRQVKDLGLETCATLGMLNEDQAKELKDSGLDYYNHNIDTSEEYYDSVITTRTFQDRLDTIQRVQNAGLKVCCGGIMGMGETPDDRIGFLTALANMNPQPESVPINQLVAVSGTPLENEAEISSLDFVRVIAAARILMPKSYVRLSAGRLEMSAEMQTLCFLAGANSVFIGDKLLTTPNQKPVEDSSLFAELGLTFQQSSR